MKNNLFIICFGAVIILGGLILLFGDRYTFSPLRLTLTVALLFGVVIALGISFFRNRKKLQFEYHTLHKIALFSYGSFILVFVNAIEILTYFTVFLLLLYTFIEIVFCSWLFNLKDTAIFKIVLLRLFIGLLLGLGTVISMSYYFENKIIVMQGYGLFLAVIGFNLLLYAPIMKNKIDEGVLKISFDSSLSDTNF